MRDFCIRLAVIALLDDDERGFAVLKGVLRGFADHTVRWFSSYASFQQDGRLYDLLLLDYALEREKICTDQMFADLRPRAQTIIAFSSSPTANRRLIACGADFAVDKFSPRSSEQLAELIMELL